MSDETTTPTPEPEDAPKQELTKEQVAEYLSVPVESLDRFKNLDEMAREVMRDKSEIGRAKKAATAAPAADDDDDAVDPTTIDPKTKKLLKAFIEQEYGQSLSLPAAQAEDEVSEAVESFMAANTDVPPEVLVAVMEELDAVGAGPKKPTRRATTEFLKVAYSIAKARAFDPEAAEKAAKEKALEELSKEAQERGEVVRVEKKSGVTEKVNPDKAAVEMGFWDRVAANT